MMNHLLDSHQPDQNIRSVAVDRAPLPTPKIDKIIEVICADARKDALRYAIRSDTGQDGE